MMMSQKLKFNEIMGFASIFGKSMMKNAYLPKISISLQFGGKILALLCPDDSIQNPSNFVSVPNVKNTK